MIDIRINKKWPSGSYGVSSLNIGLSRPPVPLKHKEMYVENIWRTSKAVHVSGLVFQLADGITRS